MYFFFLLFLKLQKTSKSIQYLWTSVPKWHSEFFPHHQQVLNKLVHHGPGVLGRGGDAQLLLSPRHRWVVDGLHVVAVVPYEFIRDLGAQQRIPHLLVMLGFNNHIVSRGRILRFCYI